MKFFLFISAFALVSVAFGGETAEITTTFFDDTTESKEILLDFDENGKATLEIAKSAIGKNVKYIDIIPSFSQAKVGDDGFFISSFGELTKFIPRKGKTTGISHDVNLMPIHGSKTPSGAFLTHIRGMRFAYLYKVEKIGDSYMNYVRFDFDKNPPYEDVKIDFVKFPETAGYVEMAKYYRSLRIKKDGLKPIAEKMKKRPELAYAVEAPEIRILLGIKRSRPRIEEQIPENEPPVVVYNSLDDVALILDELKNAGVKKAEICLVGWNKGGHDGRYPQILPIEEKIGGETKLRELIKKGQSMGYQMTCHANATDGYSIADCWNSEFVAKDRIGNFKWHTIGHGGRMYDLCLKRWYKLFSEEHFKAISDIGFRGLHYIDVVSSIYPYQCFDKRHPMTPSAGAKYARKIFGDSNKYFGGSYSEGGIDYAFETLDACLWVYVEHWFAWSSGLVDERIPFWQIVYNGIVLSTPWNRCSFPGYPGGKWETELGFFEFGGRPRCEYAPRLSQTPPEKRLESAKAFAKSIKRICDKFDKIAQLQLEFLDDRRELAPKVVYTKRSGGTEIVCNYSEKPYSYKDREVKPREYLIFRPDGTITDMR